jgi:hypothetical protein
MFSRRVAARVASLPTNSSAVVSPSSTSAAALSRTLSTTASQRKAPSLSDIAPDQAHTFAEKQKQFRDNLAELHRKKKEQERQSAASASTSSSSAIASASSVVNAASEAVSQGLGSLSTATGEAGRQKDAASGLSGESSSNSTVGRLSSLIYGTEEGREMDREIERSFSQTLARGKYVHSIVFHEVYPDKVEEYVELVSKWYPRMAGMPENKVNLVGSWRTEVGDNDTFGMQNLPNPRFSPPSTHSPKSLQKNNLLTISNSIFSQCTSGNTNAIPATTPVCTASNPTRISPPSTRN